MRCRKQDFITKANKRAVVLPPRGLGHIAISARRHLIKAPTQQKHIEDMLKIMVFTLFSLKSRSNLVTQGSSWKCLWASIYCLNEQRGSHGYWWDQIMIQIILICHSQIQPINSSVFTEVTVKNWGSFLHRLLCIYFFLHPEVSPPVCHFYKCRFRSILHLFHRLASCIRLLPTSSIFINWAICIYQNYFVIFCKLEQL